MRIFQKNRKFHYKKLYKRNKNKVKVYNNILNSNKYENKVFIKECSLLWKKYGGRRDIAKSFWIEKNMKPRCLLEKFALECGKFHCDNNFIGVEYWVQYRTGDIHSQDTKNGLEFHFDKDEILMESNDIWKHPYCSTVTYLDNNDENNNENENKSNLWGAPIIIFNTKSIETHPYLKPRNYLNRELDLSKMSPNKGWICYPCPGRHVRFNGNMLHGVPSELNTILYHNENGNYQRLALAVNIWKKEKPTGVLPIFDDFIEDVSNLLETKSSSFNNNLNLNSFFTVNTQKLKLKSVSISQDHMIPKLNTTTPSKSSSSLFSNIKIKSKKDKLTEVEESNTIYVLSEHRPGDTGVIPIDYLVNDFKRVRNQEEYNEYNGIQINYKFNNY